MRDDQFVNANGEGMQAVEARENAAMASLRRRGKIISEHCKGWSQEVNATGLTKCVCCGRDLPESAYGMEAYNADGSGL